MAVCSKVVGAMRENVWKCVKMVSAGGWQHVNYSITGCCRSVITFDIYKMYIQVVHTGLIYTWHVIIYIYYMTI